MLPSLWAGCCLGGKTSAGLISALIAERTTRGLLLQALTGQDVVIHVSGGKKTKIYTNTLCRHHVALKRSPLPVENLISCPSGGAVSLGFIWSHSKIFKTPSRSSSLSRQPCFFFFFSFLKIYIFLFVFVLLLLQTVKEKTLIANGCIRKKNGKKNLQKKKRTLKKKKKTQKTAFTFPLKFIVSDLIKQSTKSCLIVTLKLAESCRFSKDRQRPIRSKDCRAVMTRGNNFTSPALSSLPPLLYLSTRAAPTGYLQDCLSLDAENDCHPPFLPPFFFPLPCQVELWSLGIGVCTHVYIWVYMYTFLIYPFIHI